MIIVDVVFETRISGDQWVAIFRTPDGKETVSDPFPSEAEAISYLQEVMLPEFAEIVLKGGGKFIGNS